MTGRTGSILAFGSGSLHLPTPVNALAACQGRPKTCIVQPASNATFPLTLRSSYDGDSPPPLAQPPA
eukprot:1398175-Alexandrium_andersonii.AAC.1